jgi:hypothetical protein
MYQNWCLWRHYQKCKNAEWGNEVLEMLKKFLRKLNFVQNKVEKGIQKNLSASLDPFVINKKNIIFIKLPRLEEKNSPDQTRPFY